ncbi:hypothetical protein BBJ28_00019933, partial [Nothophytophthora sp. Chile5]
RGGSDVGTESSKETTIETRAASSSRSVTDGGTEAVSGPRKKQRVGGVTRVRLPEGDEEVIMSTSLVAAAGDGDDGNGENDDGNGGRSGGNDGGSSSAQTARDSVAPRGTQRGGGGGAGGDGDGVQPSDWWELMSPEQQRALVAGQFLPRPATTVMAPPPRSKRKKLDVEEWSSTGNLSVEAWLDRVHETIQRHAILDGEDWSSKELYYGVSARLTGAAAEWFHDLSARVHRDDRTLEVQEAWYVEAFLEGINNKFAGSMARMMQPITLQAAVHAAVESCGEYGEGREVGWQAAAQLHARDRPLGGTAVTASPPQGTAHATANAQAGVLDGMNWNKLGLGLAGSGDEPPRFDKFGKRVSVLAATTGTGRDGGLSLAALQAIAIATRVGQVAGEGPAAGNTVPAATKVKAARALEVKAEISNQVSVEQEQHPEQMSANQAMERRFQGYQGGGNQQGDDPEQRGGHKANYGNNTFGDGGRGGGRGGYGRGYGRKRATDLEAGALVSGGNAYPGNEAPTVNRNQKRGLKRQRRYTRWHDVARTVQQVKESESEQVASGECQGKGESATSGSAPQVREVTRSEQRESGGYEGEYGEEDESRLVEEHGEGDDQLDSPSTVRVEEERRAAMAVAEEIIGVGIAAMQEAGGEPTVAAADEEDDTVDSRKAAEAAATSVAAIGVKTPTGLLRSRLGGSNGRTKAAMRRQRRTQQDIALARGVLVAELREERQEQAKVLRGVVKKVIQEIREERDLADESNQRRDFQHVMAVVRSIAAKVVHRAEHQYEEAAAGGSTSTTPTGVTSVMAQVPPVSLEGPVETDDEWQERVRRYEDEAPKYLEEAGTLKEMRAGGSSERH